MNAAVTLKDSDGTMTVKIDMKKLAMIKAPIGLRTVKGATKCDTCGKLVKVLRDGQCALCHAAHPKDE